MNEKNFDAIDRNDETFVNWALIGKETGVRSQEIRAAIEEGEIGGTGAAIGAVIGAVTNQLPLRHLAWLFPAVVAHTHVVLPSGHTVVQCTAKYQTPPQGWSISLDSSPRVEHQPRLLPKGGASALPLLTTHILGSVVLKICEVRK
ncbi:hypothetical protein EMCRGX_G015716 [Ephydatia muelleri]